MGKEAVKINANGRLTIIATPAQAEVLKPVLERLIQQLSNIANAPAFLNNNNARERVYLDLLQDLYVKYHTLLSLRKERYKLTLSKAQAIAIWDLGQQYDNIVYCHPVMNHLMLLIHQKLS